MVKSTATLSIKQARKLVLLSQRVPPKKQSGKAATATQSIIEHLGYIQIDTISAIQRAHHHTIWNRNPRYRTTHIDLLLKEKKVFEYWSHAAAYLPMCDYRYSLVRKRAIVQGDQSHWYEQNKPLMKAILKRIATEGPLMLKDFDDKGQRTGVWGSTPIKRALGNLYMQGDLMIPYRKNFHKVYELTERVIPENLDTTLPDNEEYARHLINRYLIANGIGQAAEIAYLLKNTKSLVESYLKEMTLSGELSEVMVKGIRYYVQPNSLELLNQPLSRTKLKILSPFDNLLIQRKRIKNLFNFDYILECYVPKSKRQYGYFSLPILWEGKLVARMDCTAERKKSLLHIHHISLEADLVKMEAFALALCKELRFFLEFNGCTRLQLHNTSPNNFKPVLVALLRELLNEHYEAA